MPQQGFSIVRSLRIFVLRASGIFQFGVQGLGFRDVLGLQGFFSLGLRVWVVG